MRRYGRRPRSDLALWRLPPEAAGVRGRRHARPPLWSGRPAPQRYAWPIAAALLRRAQSGSRMSEAIARPAPGFRPRIALVLGSGLGGFADDVCSVATIPYSDLPGFPETSVAAHAGRLVLGHVGP